MHLGSAHKMSGEHFAKALTHEACKSALLEVFTTSLYIAAVYIKIPLHLSRHQSCAVPRPAGQTCRTSAALALPPSPTASWRALHPTCTYAHTEQDIIITAAETYHTRSIITPSVRV